MQDSRNLILAIVLSVAILFGFQFLFQPAEQPDPDVQQATEQAGEEGVEGLPTDVIRAEQEEGDVDTGALTDQLLEQADSRQEALDADPRVTIDTPRLHGSLSLVGGRIDDLTLADYQVTLEENSPEVVLLSPRQAPDPYYADFGWVPADGEVAVPGPDTEWSTDDEALTPATPVVLTWDNGEGLTFERTVAIDEDYMFTVTQRVINNGDEAVALVPYGRVQRTYPDDLVGFFILHEGPYGVFNGSLDEWDYGDLVDEDIAYQTTGGWIGFTDKYWLVALVPDQSADVSAQFVHRDGAGGGRYFATFAREAVAVAPGASAEVTNRVFAGAKEVSVIDAYEAEFSIDGFGLTIDWGWFYFLTRPFFLALDWIAGLVGNFGLAILIFTVLIKLLFFPLANKSYKSMSRMKALQPQMQQIRERYKDDRQKMNQAIMEMYRREKVNPASGCLPILVQIPVFFALYKVLFVTIEMRHAPFFGWVQDLSAVDPTSVWNIFGLLPFEPANYLPAFLLLGAWPILMGLTMYGQQKLNPAPADPMQKRIIGALPIVFTFVLSTFPAGLVIYWTWNNLLSVAQQYIIMKRMGVKIGGGVDKSAVAANAPPPPSVRRKQSKTNGGQDKAQAAEDDAAEEVDEPEAEAEREAPAKAAEPPPASVKPRPGSQARAKSGGKSGGGKSAGSKSSGGRKRSSGGKARRR
jgi:YidC/Oxa1 family membrane protein insertase